MIARRAYRPRVPGELVTLFEEHGLSALGVADAEPAPDKEAEFAEWLSHGYHGEMAYLESHTEAKFRPEQLLDGCRSIVIAAMSYHQSAPWGRGRAHAVPNDGSSEFRGRIARYAWGRDYHNALGKRLKRAAKTLSQRYPEHRFRPFTDATPLAERHYAARAGVAFQGRNTLAISSSLGSWFVIGEIISTRWWPPSGPATSPSGNRHGACPSGCTRCIDVCPTGALYAPHRIDASRCISYLTIELKGSIPEHLRPKIGSWLFGCDLCQEVCPLNVRAEVTDQTDFLRARAGHSRPLAELMDIESDAEFHNRFAGTPLMRAGRVGMIRNACVVAANVGAVELVPRLRRLAIDPDPIIAEHASWALEQLT